MQNLECPFAIQCEIDRDEFDDYSSDGFFKTEWFEASNIPGVKYYLKLYTIRGYVKLWRQTWVSLNVSVGKETEVQADYQISIESAGLNIKEKFKYIKDTGFGSKCCKTKEELLSPRFFIDEKLTIKCEGILSVARSRIYANKKWKHEGFLKNIWIGDNKDFTIVVGEEIIQVCFLFSM